jgi:hypothetical protein
VVLRRTGSAGERRAGAARWCVGGERSLAQENERRGQRLRSGGGKEEKKGTLDIYMSDSCR